ncbi:ATP synthase subunit e, mitochondrial [Erysiphe necator]|nr:ATP synthase subunit e, mitochondrial [Erysiphe necator]
MASTGVNVLRYSVLGAGLIYGFLHQSKLSSASKLSAINKNYQYQQDLINKAKMEYAKRNLPSSSSSNSFDARLDPNDSQFDFEAFLMKAISNNP